MVGSSACSMDGLNRGAWTAQEDEILIDYLKSYGKGRWRTLPKKAGLKRCGKSCRLRWLNYLRPDIKRGNMSEEEEELIIRMHKLLGNRWSLIAGRLPGRTDNEIKNYWNTIIVKKLQQHSLPFATSDKKCPMPKQRKISSRKRSSKTHRLDHKLPAVSAATLLTSMETVNPLLGEQGNTKKTMAHGKEEEGTRQINKDTSLVQHAQGFENALTNSSVVGGRGFSYLMHVPEWLEWLRFPGEMVNEVEGSKDNHHHHNDQQLGEASGWLDEVMMEELLRGEDCTRHAGLDLDQGADPICVFQNPDGEWI